MSGQTPAVPSLEEMAQAIAAEREQLDAAWARFRELKGPYDAAVEERVRLQRSVARMEEALAMSKQAHAADCALEDAGIKFDGPRVVTSAVYEGAQFYVLAAVGPKGTGLYLHTPKKSGRYSGKEHVVRLVQAQAHGFDPEAPRPPHFDQTSKAQEEAGLVAWQARGKGDYGRSGAYRPVEPPEGGRWQWLKLLDQEALAEGQA